MRIEARRRRRRKGSRVSRVFRSKWSTYETIVRSIERAAYRANCFLFRNDARFHLRTKQHGMLLGINHQINLPIYFTSLHAPPGKLNRETTDIEFTFEEKCPRRKKLVRTVDRGQKWKRSLEVSKAALHALLHVWRRCPLAKVPRFRRACAIRDEGREYHYRLRLA